MDDQYRMIQQNIDALLDEHQDAADTFIPTMEQETPVTMMRPPNGFLPYKCLEVEAREPLIMGQYTKWSTIESDELYVQKHHSMGEQPTFCAPPMLPALTVEMMQNILFNFWNAKLRQNMTMSKRSCSFCKKNGMSDAIYTSHSLRINGVLQCPYLLRCQCTNCYKNGHTTSYCPMKDRITTAPGLAYTFLDRNPINRYNTNY